MFINVVIHIFVAERSNFTQLTIMSKPLVDAETVMVSMPKNQFDFLTKLSEKLRTQDNRYTANPIFHVIDLNDVIVDGEYSPVSEHGDVEKRYGYVNPENTEDGFIEEEDVDKWCEENEIQKDDLTYLCIAEMPYVVNSHLTIEGADRFIAENKHNLKKPYTYTTSLFRCWDMIELREFLIDFNK